MLLLFRASALAAAQQRNDTDSILAAKTAADELSVREEALRKAQQELERQIKRRSDSQKAYYDAQERQAELMELQQEIAFDNAENMIGREMLVMIEGKVADENAFVGRTYRDAPNVDGLIFINTDEELISGDFAKVKVTGALDYDLIGELI